MPNKAYDLVMGGTNDSNIRFSDLRYVLESHGFYCRVRGDHYIYSRPDVLEIVNIQPIRKMAKTYQVRQVRRIFNKYNI